MRASSPPPDTRYAPATIGTIATSADAPGSCPSVIAATTSAKSGVMVGSGEVRSPDTPLAEVQERPAEQKCTTPAAAKAISGHAPASSSRVRSSVASATPSSASAAMTRFMNVAT